MDYNRSIVLIDSSEIINIVRRSLSKIDRRLVDHGERVGYIAQKIYEESEAMASAKAFGNSISGATGFGERASATTARDDAASSNTASEIDSSMLFILALLHDIGAYKAEEVDSMVQFETDMSFDHSLYGYLFLKNTDHLSTYAEAILYHHTDYDELKKKDSVASKYANIIHLADRLDILLKGGTDRPLFDGDSVDMSIFQEKAGQQFNPVYVEALLSAEKKYDISGAVLSGGYKKYVDARLGLIQIDNRNIMEYLKLLVFAIDFRSPYTVTHTADTTMISLETGKLLGLSEHDLSVLYVGAFLHDIGKIAIPHDILEKPGKLTDEEFDIVKTHITEGEAILRGVVSDEISDIALRHHEKLDGSGYSKGLPGNELTLPQRIVAVADILGALTQRRSYKEPFPKEKVFAILKDMKDSGKICPKVTDTVCENYDSLMASIEASHDPVKSMYSSLTDEYDRLRQANY